MRSCRQITELISLSQERPLTFMEKLELRFHTAMCKACRNFERNVDLLRKSMEEFQKKDR